MSAEKRMEELRSLQPQSTQELKESSVADIKMPATWKVSAETRNLIKQSLEIYNTKHGMYSSIPMMCKGAQCPYASICPILEGGADPSGQRCPLEIGLILKRYEEYVGEFLVDESNIVDMGFVKDLIDCDIQEFRAENRIAMDGDFVEEYVVTVTEGGETVTDTRIAKAAEYKERIGTKKHKILQLMNATRKDKAGDKMTITLDPSSYAASLMSQLDMKPGQFIEAEYDDEQEYDDED